MAQYDGSIRIGTEITTKQAKKELKSLENSISRTAEKIVSLRSKMDVLKNAHIPTAEYKKLQRELDSTITKYTELDARVNDFKKIGMDVKSDAFRRTQDEAQELYMRIEDIRGAMFGLEESGKAFTLGIDTEKYAQMSVQLQQLNQQMESDTQRQSELQSAIAAEEERLAQIREHAVVSEQMIVETAERRKQLLQEIADLEAAGVTHGYQDYDSRIQELAEIERKLKDYSSRTKEMAASYKSFGQSMRQMASRSGGLFSSLRDSLKRLDSSFKRLGERARNTFSRINKSAQKSGGIFTTMASRIKGLALSLLIFNQISKAFNAMTHAIRDGFKNLYEDNERFKNSVDSLNASVLTLKNAFAAAFRPIVDMAIPYIQKLVEWLTVVVNLAGQFFAALTGRKTYTRAIKQTAKASEEAAEAAEEETDAMKKQLSPLDKLNNLTSENNKKKDKDKDDEAGTGIMFEEVPIDSNIQKMADKVKDILSKLFEPIKKAWKKEGKFVMDSWKYALKEIWKLVKDIGRDFLKVWRQDATVKIFENIFHIIGDIGLVVGHLARNFRDAWNENEVGLHILENIRDIIGIIISHIRRMADETVKWADKLNFYPLLDAFNRFLESIKPVADAVWGILEDFYTKVMLPLGKWTLEKGLPDLLQVFIDFNNKVNWDALRERLSDFWAHLEPFAETVGEGLIIFIERVSDALADFINSEAFNNFLTRIEEWMDSVTPEDVANGLEMIVGALVGLKAVLIEYSAIKGISTVFDTIKSFLAIFGVGGSATTAAAGMDTVAASIGGLSTALTALAGVAAVAGSYKLLTGHLEELFSAFGKSTDQGRRLEERYDGLDGAARFAKDGIDALKNGIEGYGFAADNCVGSGVALEKAMEDIQNGAILTDEHMKELQNRFSLTNDDMEMLRQEMLDTNPILREIADNLGFEGASAETLYDIAEGFSYIANGIEPLPNQMSEMTDEARDFISRVEEGVNPMEVYGEKLENIGSIADNANESLNNMGKNIADGVTKGMEEADVGAASDGFFSKVVASIKEVFGIASPAKNMMPFGEFITLGILEGFRSKFSAFSAQIQQLCSMTTSKITNGLQPAKIAWSNAWMSMKDRTVSILSSIREAVRSAVDWISQKIKSITSMLSSIRSTASGLFSGNTSRGGISSRIASSYSAHPAIEKLNNMPISAYATGQVIPRTMQKHLAWLGDNPRETEVVSPLSTIRQALRDEAVALGLAGGNSIPEINLNLSVECEGYQLLHIMQKLDSEYYKQNGRHVFA